jgi:NAD(P)-dependent dehydrogenase (short-subunit alcohol dehydrogenase family)
VSTIDFTGQVAVVTGAGRGLGRSYALALAERGAAVVVNELGESSSAADDVVEEIVTSGGRAVAAYGSVTSAADAQRTIETALETFGGLDAVVNNAGSIRPARFEDMSPDQFAFMLDVHLTGSFHISQAAYRHMITAGGGRIVNTASSAGAFGMPAMANYCAAKAGVLGLTRALALDGATHGIQVNAILPNAETTISKTHPIPGDSAADGGPRALKERLVERFRPETVAPLVVFLASTVCPCTGEAFTALAGRFARVVTATTPGWTADSLGAIEPQDIAQHFDEIMALTEFAFPTSVADEHRLVAEALQLT